MYTTFEFKCSFIVQFQSFDRIDGLHHLVLYCRIYALQDAGYAYSSVEGLLTAAGKHQLAELLDRSLSSVLREQGIGDK